MKVIKKSITMEKVKEEVENMEKNERNKKLAILVGTLLLVIGVSFAYFTGVRS